MTKTFMRTDKELLDKIRKLKIAKRESYSDVVERLINKETNINKLKKMPKGLTAWERENWREMN